MTAVRRFCRAQFEKFYWPTLKEIIEALWFKAPDAFYAEGEWNPNLHIAQLPDLSIVYHGPGRRFEVHKALGHKFCLSGEPERPVIFGTPEDVRACCKKVIDGGPRRRLRDDAAIMTTPRRTPA
jgi:hypothetical protein